MTKDDREHVIDSLFYDMTSSAFAEGCEDKIAGALCSMSDDELIKRATEKGTWTP